MQNVSILGSTGSIGRNALEVISHHRDKFKIVGLAAGNNVELLLKQVEEYGPKIISLSTEKDAGEFKKSWKGESVLVVCGHEGAESVAKDEENDIVVSAITGINGLRPSLAAVCSGKKVALANKESMVVAGPLIKASAEKYGTRIIPVDSEHSGVFQCLAKEKSEDVQKVILTASGGPFFQFSREQMKGISLEDALNHPRWKMGRKVSIDSATLMNKGLELIEAKWLFGLESKQLDVLIHPQSIVHSFVEMRDGSVLAQLSLTDMKIPIQYALTYPRREEGLLPSLNLSQVRSLEFYDVDLEKFPLISLASSALEEEQSFSVVLNAANEEAVDAFLNKKISFSDIAEIVIRVVEGHKPENVDTLDNIILVDREARLRTRKFLDQKV